MPIYSCLAVTKQASQNHTNWPTEGVFETIWRNEERGESDLSLGHYLALYIIDSTFVVRMLLFVRATYQVCKKVCFE